MRWGEKRYNSLDFQLKKEFGEKIYKVSLDGGFTCPNRDGTISKEGCIFCSDRGSGEFTGDSKKSITIQINEQINFLNKGENKKYIAYFQNFTNTYGEVAYLRKIYMEALLHPNIVALAIATRADCLDDNVLELLDELNKEYFIWLEIGLQSIHEESAKLINRGYGLDTFNKSIDKLKKINIKFVVHLIIGLPYETREHILKSIEYMNKIMPWGIKIHLLYIIRGTSLHNLYLEKPFNIFSKEEYVALLIEIIEKLDENIGIHRLTGDGVKESLIEPKWSLNKRDILNKINSKLKNKNTWQGKEKV